MGKWKAVQQPINSPVRLYDLDKDVGEAKDVAAQHADVVAKMKKRMDESDTPSPRWKFPVRK
jgi:hypothetical protein